MVLAGCLMLLQACSASEIVSDVCLCECCQQDETGAFNCSTRVSTSAEVESCEECSASLCRVTFPQECTSRSHVELVRTQCVERDGWHLMVVPVLFVVLYAVMFLAALMSLWRKSRINQETSSSSNVNRSRACVAEYLYN